MFLVFFAVCFRSALLNLKQRADQQNTWFVDALLSINKSDTDQSIWCVAEFYSLDAETQRSLDGLALSDQVRSVLVLLPQNLLTLPLGYATVVTLRQSRCHGERGPRAGRPTSTCTAQELLLSQTALKMVGTTTQLKPEQLQNRAGPVSSRCVEVQSRTFTERASGNQRVVLTVSQEVRCHNETLKWKLKDVQQITAKLTGRTIQPIRNC